MLQLGAGSGDWAVTVEGYGTSFDVTLRVNRVNVPLTPTTNLVSATFVFGGITWFASVLGGWSQQAAPPPVHQEFAWQCVLGCTVDGVPTTPPYYDATTDAGLIRMYAGDPPLPTYIERVFHVEVENAFLAERQTYAPVRGVTTQSMEEISEEGRWSLDKDLIASHATLGAALSKSYAAGTLLPSSRVDVGADVVLAFDYTASAGDTVEFKDIAFDGHAAPCGDLNELGGDALGSGDDIICKNQDWSGTIWPPIRVQYWTPPLEGGIVRSPVCRMATGGGIESYDGVPVVDTLMTLRDGVASVPSETLHGFDSGLLWRLSGSGGTWISSPSWAHAWLIGPRKTLFSILAAWASAGGAEEDEKDDDRTICIRGYPLSDRVKTAGRVAALTFAHLGPQEVEFPEGSGTRRSNWGFISGLNATCTNNPADTHFVVNAGGFANIERILVNDWEARVLASATPWDEIMKLLPILPTEDFHNWSNYGAAEWTGAFSWSAAGDRAFEVRVTYNTYPNMTDDHNANPALRVFSLGAAVPVQVTYLVVVPEARNGVATTTVVSDLAFPFGATVLPRLFHVAEIAWLNLVPGDDVQYTSMQVLKQVGDEGTDGDSTRLQLSFPDSKDGADRFGCAGLISGQLTFDETDDGLMQTGVQVGIAHSYPLYTFAGDVSGLRVIDEAAGPYGLAQMLNYQQGWTATALDITGALEDADGNVLIGPAMMMLEEVFDLAAGTAYLSTRYASYIPAYGQTFIARPHKILRGAFHGLAFEGNRVERASAGEVVEVALCSGGSPTGIVVATVTCDPWGHWNVGELLEDYLYAARYALTPTCLSDVNAERRWVESGVQVLGKRLCAIRDKIGELIVYTGQGGTLTRYLSTDDRLFDKHPPVPIGPGWNPSAWERSKDSPWHEVAFDYNNDVYTEAGNCFGQTNWGEIRENHIGGARLVSAEWMPNEGAGKVLYLDPTGHVVYTSEFLRRADGAHLTVGLPVDVTADFAGRMPQPGSGYMKGTPNDIILVWDDGATVYAALSPRSFIGPGSEWYNQATLCAGRLVGCCYLPTEGVGIVVVKAPGPVWATYEVHRSANNALSAHLLASSSELAAVAPKPYGDLVQNPTGALVLAFFDSADVLRTAMSKTFGREWVVA